MKNIILFCFILISCSGVFAFSNSLDGSGNGFPNKNNNFSLPKQNTFKNTPPQPLNPKEHTGFTHGDGKYVNPNINDTRYNSNCQFGQCIPGGLNPNNQ